MYPGTWAATTPDRPAVVMAGSGRTLTYAELDDRSLRLARHLRARGLVEGDVVALLSDNAPEAYEVYWAALRSGLYITAVNHNLSADEASYIVRDCGARALVVSAAKADLAGALDVEVGERLVFGGPVEATARTGSTTTRPRWPPPATSRSPSSRTATTSSTPPARPGGPRASRSACPRSGSTSRATSTSRSSAGSTGSARTPSTSRRPRSTTPRRCGSAASCTPSAGPSW